MHDDEVDIDEDLARRLIDAQFSTYSGLSVRIVEPWGTDNAIWRLGHELVVRFPRIAWARGQVDFEATWLPRFTPLLPIELPTPIAVGEPAFGYPFRWSLHRWVAGDGATIEGLADPNEYARQLARVARSIWSMPTDGGRPARNRARDARDYDDSTRTAIESARAFVDVDAAVALWDAALAAPPHTGGPVWVHGDLDFNCLILDGRLSGLVDWGSACVGDPAVDVQVVWSELFTESSRTVFLDAVDADDAVIARSRGAALHQACAALPYYLHTYPLIVRRSRHKLRALGVLLHDA